MSSPRFGDPNKRLLRIVSDIYRLPYSLFVCLFVCLFFVITWKHRIWGISSGKFDTPMSYSNLVQNTKIGKTIAMINFHELNV